MLVDVEVRTELDGEFDPPPSPPKTSFLYIDGLIALYRFPHN